MSENPLLVALSATIGILESENIPYALIGGIALMGWGAGRSTVDIDLAAVLAPDSATKLSDVFTATGFAVGATHADEQVMGLRAIHGITGVSVDFLCSVNSTMVEIVGRRVRRDLLDVSAWTVCAEDLIVLKLQAGRARDVDDVMALVAANRSTLDISLLFAQARAFGVDEALAKIWD